MSANSDGDQIATCEARWHACRPPQIIREALKPEIAFVIACQILQAPFDLLDHARPVWRGHNAPFVWPVRASILVYFGERSWSKTGQVRRPRRSATATHWAID